MIADLDSADRIIRYKMAMTCVMDLLDWQAEERPGVQPHRLSMVLHILHEELERATPPRPCLRAVNDLDGE